VLLRLAYLGVTNALALLRLLPRTDRDKDAEILALRHQIVVLQRHLGRQRIRFEPVAPRPCRAPPRRRLASEAARPAAYAALDPHPGAAAGRENSSWGYRRVHGELLTLGVKVAASTVWEILREAGIDPAPDRSATTWADVLRSQANALVAADFIETVTLTGYASTSLR